MQNRLPVFGKNMKNSSQTMLKIIPMSKNKSKGFAIGQVLLAVAIGSMIAIGTVGYFIHTSNTQKTKVVVDRVVKLTASSAQRNSVGMDTPFTVSVDGVQVTTHLGKASISNLTASSCNKLSRILDESGDVTSSKCNAGTDQNSIMFSYDKSKLEHHQNANISSGIADAGSGNKTNNPDLAGNTNAVSTLVGLGNTSGSMSGSMSGTNFNKDLLGGIGGTVNGGTISMPAAELPPVYEGDGSMSCRWRLANDTIFSEKDLGTRNTPCDPGYVSVTKQTGKRTYSCPNPTAVANPIGTDTWSGGTCAPSCNSRLGTGTYVTTSLGTRATVCSASETSTSNETGTRTWTCGANGNKAVNPTSVDKWVGGSCSATCVPSAPQTKDIGCPAGYTGQRIQVTESYCPSPTGSPTWKAPYDSTNTCALNTSCVGYGANYAWNASKGVCDILCSAKKPADTYIGTRPTVCVGGQVSSSDQTGWNRFRCPADIFGNPYSAEEWTGGGCKDNLSYRWTQVEDHFYGGWGGMGQEYAMCGWSEPGFGDINGYKGFNPGSCSASNAGQQYYCTVLVPQSNDQISSSVYECKGE